jgi:hypothetical protein
MESANFSVRFVPFRFNYKNLIIPNKSKYLYASIIISLIVFMIYLEMFAIIDSLSLRE